MLCNEVVGFWWGNISHHPWNFSIVNAFSFRKMFFVLTEEDADIVEHNKKTQLINFICNFSTFQITSVSVPFLTYSPPRHGTKTQISPTCKFNSICLTFCHQIMWLFLICLNCFAFWFFFFLFLCVWWAFSPHRFLKWKLTSRLFHVSGNRNLGSGCNTRTFLCVQIFSLSSSVTLRHQRTTNVSSSQVLKSHIRVRVTCWIRDWRKHFIFHRSLDYLEVKANSK